MDRGPSTFKRQRSTVKGSEVSFNNNVTSHIEYLKQAKLSQSLEQIYLQHKLRTVLVLEVHSLSYLLHSMHNTHQINFSNYLVAVLMEILLHCQNKNGFK